MLQLFSSDLIERKQYISLNSDESKALSVSSGAPQGSVLGPSLLILYIHDVRSELDVDRCILFADDTTLLTIADQT